MAELTAQLACAIAQAAQEKAEEVQRADNARRFRGTWRGSGQHGEASRGALDLVLQIGPCRVEPASLGLLRVRGGSVVHLTFTASVGLHLGLWHRL